MSTYKQTIHITGRRKLSLSKGRDYKYSREKIDTRQKPITERRTQRGMKVRDEEELNKGRDDARSRNGRRKID